MNKERPDESEAKQFVQKVLGLQLEHADKNGGVDYRSRDGRHALEVSRVTDGRKRAGRDALGVSRETGTPAGELKTCWIAFAPDTQSGLKTFLQSVHPALVALESAGETLFEGQSAAARLIEKGRLSGIHLQLLEAGVERASAVPNHAHVSHSHRVFPVLSSGGTAGGSDDAVGLLTEELLKTGDNLKKLRASGAEHRHLFVWLDDDTRFDIARPLSREAPSWHDGFGLPSMSPALILQSRISGWCIKDQDRAGSGMARPGRDLFTADRSVRWRTRLAGSTSPHPPIGTPGGHAHVGLASTRRPSAGSSGPVR